MSAVVPQRNHCLTDETFLLVPVENKTKTRFRTNSRCKTSEQFLLKMTPGQVYLPGCAAGVTGLVISHLYSPCPLRTWFQGHYKRFLSTTYYVKSWMSHTLQFTLTVCFSTSVMQSNFTEALYSSREKHDKNQFKV